MSCPYLMLLHLSFAFLCACSPQVPSTSTADTSQNSAPDIILILADDMGYGDWAPTGGPMRTPVMSRLCAEGVRLDRYYTYPLCTPTRTALMSGISPMRFNMAFSPLRRFEHRSLPREVQTLADHLHQLHYQTALIGKWHLGHMERWMWPNQRGFDHFYGFLTGAIQYYSHVSGPVGRDWQRNGVSLDEKGYSTTLFGKEASSWIAAQDKDKPLFVYLPFNAPHVPLMVPQEFMVKYKTEVPDIQRRRFCGMVDAMDAAIGEVMEAVQARNRGVEPLVIFLSDNGGSVRESGSNGPLRGNKGTTYEGAIRVPGVVWWPGHLPAGVVSPALVDVLDWVPTILSAAGAKNLSAFDGQNMLPTLAATNAESQTEPREDLFFAACISSHISYAVIRWPWKCVLKIRRANDKETIELFRLDDDPYEEHNVRRKHPELAEELAQAIRDWMAEQLPGEDYKHPSDCLDKKWPQDWVEPKDWTHPPS